MANTEHIAIVGNGIAGITAARHIRKYTGHRITVISEETDYFFSRTALMYVYMGHMKFDRLHPYPRDFWRKNSIDLVRDRVTGIDLAQSTLAMEKQGPLIYDKLVLATGSVPATYDWPGQGLFGVQGLYSKQDLDTLEHWAPDRGTCPRAVIVGGGLIGVELAEMLRSRDIEVTFLVRESSYWNTILPKGESGMINTHLREHGIDLRLGTGLGSIVADDQGRVRAVTLAGSGEEIPCRLVGLTTGVTPNIGFLANSGLDLGRGILVDRYLETSQPGVYAIGDCAEIREPCAGRKPIEAVWYTGRMMGETVARTVCGLPTSYDPGHWFNSAKFFDIEYQAYGRVSAAIQKPLDETHYHWRHPGKNKSLTLAYNNTTRRFLGLVAMGIRIRHVIADSWLRQEKDIDYVIAHLSDAYFDAEFQEHYAARVAHGFVGPQEQKTHDRPLSP